IAAVGVFVNESEASMLAIARRVGLDYLQLHGDEPPEQVARLKRKIPVIKAIRVRDSFRPRRLDSFGGASAILLDGFDPRRHGGTGKTFNWSLARGSNGSRRIFLAGGLTPENVAEAIRIAHPYAVDVCSGVEVRPGRKDPARIVALMWAVRTAEAKHKGSPLRKRCPTRTGVSVHTGAATFRKRSSPRSKNSSAHTPKRKGIRNFNWSSIRYSTILRGVRRRFNLLRGSASISAGRAFI